MQKIDIWKTEVLAIDTACVNLMETVRRGRKKQEAYLQGGDQDGAAWVEEGIKGLEQSLLTMRNLLTRAGWTGEMIGRLHKETSNADD